jgi:hypothetical protein
VTAYAEATFLSLQARDPRAALQYAGRARRTFARLGMVLPGWAAATAPPAPLPPPAPPPVQAPAAPLVIPPELSAWRSASSTRGFSLSIDGCVRLVDWHGHEVTARFKTVAEALAAIEADAVKWRATPRKVDPRHQPKAKATT